MFERILVPLDGSRLSGKALSYAIEVGRRFDADVILMQVVPPTSPAVLTTGDIGSPVVTEITLQNAREQDERNISHAKRYIQGQLRKVKAQGIKGSQNVVMGIPANSIMGFCRKQDIDLVVMTTHGRSGLRRALLGSVADQVIRESGVPVLVVRAKERRKK